MPSPNSVTLVDPIAWAWRAVNARTPPPESLSCRAITDEHLRRMEVAATKPPRPKRTEQQREYMREYQRRRRGRARLPLDSSPDPTPHESNC